MTCEVSKVCVIAISHNTDLRKSLGEQVSEPHDSRLLMSPSLEGMTIKPMNCNQTEAVSPVILICSWRDSLKYGWRKLQTRIFIFAKNWMENSNPILIIDIHRIT